MRKVSTSHAAILTRDFKVSLPAPEYASTQVDTYIQSGFFRFLEEALPLVLEVSPNRYKDLSYSNAARIIDILKVSPSVSRMQAAKVSRGPKKDLRKNYRSGQNLISVDLVSANYNCHRLFDPDLPLTWEDFCEEHKVPPVLALSKRWRQVVFGQIVPKRLRVVQGHEMAQVRKSLEDAGYEVIFCQADEVVVRGDPEDVEVVGTLSNASTALPLRTTLYNIHGINKQSAIRSYGDQRHLFGVPAMLYPKMFAEHILGREATVQERTFYVEGQKAVWA